MKKIIMFIISCNLYPTYAEQGYQKDEDTYIIPNSNEAWSISIRQKKIQNNLIIVQPQNQLRPPKTCETPASIACVYGLTQQIEGCPIDGTTALPTGGWGAIAVVEAYDNPYAEDDLEKFSREFGLPLCKKDTGCFSEYYTGDQKPRYNQDAADEHVLDIEWAHAMAPQAKIIMVEAQNESFEEHMKAIRLASEKVVAAGGGLVSISWSIDEFPQEIDYDSYFQTPGVVYVVSSGDYSAPARYPSSSPYVISAGGTSIIRDVQGYFMMETAWSTNPDSPVGSKSGGSGGPSLYEPRPSYQNSVKNIVGTKRGTPDISFDADPKTGVCVYSTAHGGWLKDGGTSVAAPSLAGIINSANRRAPTTNEELTYIYNNAIKNYHTYWHDIIYGNNGFPALKGYDFVTGLGSPLGYPGK